MFTLNCTAGSSPKFTVNVTDVSIPAPTLDKYIATVDKNLRHYKQVNVGYDKKTSEFRGITVNGKYLTAGTDYTDNGGLVTFSDSFVRPLGEGNVTLVFDFYEGADCEFQLTVTDTSTLEDIDTFENYTDDSQLRSAYTPNTNGNNITVSLVDSTNGKAMRFEYDVSLPNGYSGVNHALSQRNVAQYKGVSITLAGDNSGNTFTLQFKDKNDNYFEKEFAVDFYGEKTIKIPFEEFNTPSWQSSSATLDTTGIVQVAFYAGRRGNADTGAYIIDDVYFYNEEQETEGARLIDKTGTFDGSAPAAVLTKLVLNGQAISKITCGDKTLDSSTDYSWNGSQVTLNTPFTQTLENGKYEIVYHFSDGTADTFILTVINSSVTDDITVDNVTNFTSTNATDSSLTLAWDKNNKADGYTVEIYKGGKWNEIYSGADASCTAKDLRASSTYTFRIRAYKASGGTTYYSDYVRLAAKTAESSSVSNVTSFRKISATSSELIIGWAKNNSAEGYIVEQYKGGKWTEVLRTCTNSTVGFIAGDLKAGTTYTFRIRAYKTSGDTVIYSNYTRLAAVTNAN